MTEYKKIREDYLVKIEASMRELKDILVKRFTDDNSTIRTNHSVIREYLLFNID
jgi:hypothetical protein